MIKIRNSENKKKHKKMWNKDDGDCLTELNFPILQFTYKNREFYSLKLAAHMWTLAFFYKYKRTCIAFPS